MSQRADSLLPFRKLERPGPRPKASDGEDHGESDAPHTPLGSDASFAGTSPVPPFDKGGR